MNVDHILSTMNANDVRCMLIGGMNFLLRHAPVLTFDVDLWIADTPENRSHCTQALRALGAEWGATETAWGPVCRLTGDWLASQPMFCFTTPHGAVDIFRSIPGLASWTDAYARSVAECTAAGTPYCGLSDADMLRCQEALDPTDQRAARVQHLRRALEGLG